MFARALVLPVAAVAIVFTTRLINQTFGSETFAIYSLVAGLPLLIPFADLGLGAAVTNAASTASTDPAKFHAVLRRSLLIAFGIAALIAAASAAAAVTSIWSDILGVSDPTLNLPVSLAMTFFGFSIPGALGTKILLGIGRYVPGVVIQGSGPLLSLGVIGAAIGFGADTGGVVAVSTLGVFFANWIGFLYAKVVMPCAPDDFRGTRQHQVMGDVIRMAVPMIVMTSGGAVLHQSGRLVLSHTSTLEQVAVYAALWTFFQPLMSVVVTATLTLWPRFVAARAEGRDIRREFRTATITSIAIGLCAGIGLTALGPFAAHLATAGNVEVGRVQCAILGAVLVVEAIALPAGMTLNFPRGIWLQSATQWGAAVIAVAVSMLYSSSIGATAPMLGLLLGVLIAHAIPTVIAAEVLISRQEYTRG
jgi:O-antigen/teichoic acid export membrane protein